MDDLRNNLNGINEFTGKASVMKISKMKYSWLTNTLGLNLMNHSLNFNTIFTSFAAALSFHVFVGRLFLQKLYSWLISFFLKPFILHCRDNDMHTSHSENETYDGS